MRLEMVNSWCEVRAFSDISDIHSDVLALRLGLPNLFAFSSGAEKGRQSQEPYRLRPWCKKMRAEM